MTQMDRVVAAARSPRGVCQVDFLGPLTVDGGSPITRLAARIQDAEARGYTFETIGWRNRTKVYRLLSNPASAPVVPPRGEGETDVELPPALFDAAQSIEPLSTPHWKAA